MSTPGYPATIEDARTLNHAAYGPPDVARAYAEDIDGGFCEDCHIVYDIKPAFANDGHQCLEDGTTDRYLLSE